MAEHYDKSPISSISDRGDPVPISGWGSVKTELSRFAMGRGSNPESEDPPAVAARTGRQVLASIELQPGTDAQTHSGRRESLFVRWVASF